MKRQATFLAAMLFVVSCATPNRLVYSSGFSFANYDYLVIAKPETRNTGTALYGMDIEFGNLMGRYNMRVIGDKEYEGLSPENQKRTLIARVALIATGEKNLISVSFDDATTGKTACNITAVADGDIFNNEDRTKAFEAVSTTIIKALQQDKGLTISEDKK